MWVLVNAGHSTATGVTCTVTLPADKSLKAYDDLHFAVAELASGAVSTNRINLAMPLSVQLTEVPICTIEVAA